MESRVRLSLCVFFRAKERGENPEKFFVLKYIYKIFAELPGGGSRRMDFSLTHHIAL